MANVNEPPVEKTLPTLRPCLVDVFENFLGSDIAELDRDRVERLTSAQADELVQHVDDYLAAAASDEFAADAIALDGFGSPIIVPFDKGEPRTTRRAKQVALAHSEVVIPLQEFSLNYAEYGRDHLASLILWARRNEKLLRAHILSPVRTPELLDALEMENVTSLTEWLMEQLRSDAYRGSLDEVVPDWRIRNSEQLEYRLGAAIYATLQDVAVGGILGADLSFIQPSGGSLYRFCAERLSKDRVAARSLFAHSALLHSLELPAIDDVSDEDFVGIRLQSEDFAEYRDVLERALAKTAVDVGEGRELDTAFQGNLDEVRWRAELLRKDLKDKDLSKYLRATVQGVAIGSLVSTGAASASAITEGAVDLTSLAARFGASTVLGTLFALFLYSPPERKKRLLRFYDILLDR